MTGTSLHRQLADSQPPAPAGDHQPGFRGLLHDLGHQLMTVSLLAESLHADSSLPADARMRAELVAQETARALEMISAAAGDGQPGGAGGPASDQAGPGRAPSLIDVRDVAGQVARLTGLTHGTKVRVHPGPPAEARLDPMTAWRVLSNIVENAARAAGRDGRVDIRIWSDAGLVVEITDTGAGPGSAPGGSAGLGLSVVADLLAGYGGGLDISAADGGGTSARAMFGTGRDRPSRLASATAAA
jgi:signal transduction histidine kinase